MSPGERNGKEVGFTTYLDITFSNYFLLGGRSSHQDHHIVTAHIVGMEKVDDQAEKTEASCHDN